ncbi:MAG TPA: lysylphosphatidylglycerol synthase transmembrane domain-containing protein [Thermoanaerobaculia bacterium]|nr:lysylphosphatidylglycerol synthase transmembrane domain-containing protein [Thermoanaerobaculia bacterium]
MIPDETTTREPSSRAWVGRLLKVAVTVATVYFTWHFLARSNLDWALLTERVEEASRPYLALGIGLLVLRFGIWDWRFRLAAHRAVGRSSGVVLGFFVLIASAALNLVTPTVRLIGGLMRARYWSRSTGYSFGFFYGVVLYDQIAHHTMMTLCTWVTLIVASFALGRPGLGVASLIALIAAIVALAVWSRRRGPSGQNPIVRFLARRAEKAEGRLQKLFAHGHEAVGVFVHLLGYVPLRLQVLALGVLYFFVNAAAQWAMFVAIGAPVDPLVVIAVVALGNAVGTLTGTPGGLGTTELAMVASFKALGVDEVVAAAGTLLFRGLHYAAVLAIGLPALGLLELKMGKEEAEES